MAGEEGSGADVWFTKDKRRAAEIDRIHIVSPTFGTRILRRQGEAYATRLQAGKAHGICPCCPLPASRRESRRSPYLLKGKKVLFSNQVCSTNITYIQTGGKAHLPWWPPSISSTAASSPEGPLTPCVPKRLSPAPGRLSQNMGCSSIMNFEQRSVFSFYKYAFTARLHACGAEPEQKGSDGEDDALMQRWLGTLKDKCLRQEEYSTPAELKGDH